ncbi:MAG TPA: hypothetical protein VFI52_17525, partial [Gemmatimonadaceae bacterium]|nr:hypothetical protein [Gemmatimonadaceae bacterium]
MPLVAWGALAYAAGLAMALSSPAGGLLFAIAASGGVGLVAAARGLANVAACAGLVMAGGFAGLTTTAGERECRARVLGDRAWTVALAERADAGAVARGVARNGGCRVTVTMFIARGRAAPGEVATVHGLPSLE